MGKDVRFYCIDKGCPHNKEKACLGWEYQPEEDNKYFDIMEALGMPPALKPDYQAVWNAFKDGKICERCTWFAKMGQKSKMVLDTFDIHHSYSNPVLRSDWFIDHFVWGGEVAREYDRMHGEVYRFTREKIAEMRRDVEQLGRPIRRARENNEFFKLYV